MNKKVSIIVAIVLVFVISLAMLLFFAKTTTVYTSFKGAKGYPSRDCECSGFRIFNWCWGELTNCTYMD